MTTYVMRFLNPLCKNLEYDILCAGLNSIMIFIFKSSPQLLSLCRVCGNLYTSHEMDSLVKLNLIFHRIPLIL